MRKLATALAGLALLTVACSHEAEPFGRLTPAEVSAKLTQPGFFVFDNNSKATWTEGHVPGAKWVDYSNMQASDLPADKNAQLVFYCANSW